jgi:hypothetical protein
MKAESRASRPLWVYQLMENAGPAGQVGLPTRIVKHANMTNTKAFQKTDTSLILKQLPRNWAKHTKIANANRKQNWIRICE